MKTKQQVISQVNLITTSSQKVCSTTNSLGYVENFLSPNKLNTGHIVSLGSKICDTSSPKFIDVYNFYTMVRIDIVLDAQLTIDGIVPYDITMQELMQIFG